MLKGTKANRLNMPIFFSGFSGGDEDNNCSKSERVITTTLPLHQFIRKICCGLVYLKPLSGIH